MQLHLGVLGCGRVFERFHLPAIDRTPGVALAAAADPAPGRLAWAEVRSPRPALGASLDQLLAGPRLDAILILSPPESHAELAIRALEAGLHVLVEKPMALTAAEGRRMSDAARRTGRRLQVGHTRRFREPYRRLHTRLRSVDGAPAVAAEFDLAFSTTGWNAHSGFLGDEARGGGPVDDVLSHEVDLLSWLFGKAPDEARAEMGGADGGVRAELRFGTLTASCRASHGFYVERLRVTLSDGRALEATGSRLRHAGSGSAAWRGSRAMFLDRLALVADTLRGKPNVSEVSFELQLRDFDQAVRGGPSMGATAEDGLRVIQVLDACRRSARQGGAWFPLD
jgi:predicted dehydrogenase